MLRIEKTDAPDRNGPLARDTVVPTPTGLFGTALPENEQWPEYGIAGDSRARGCDEPSHRVTCLAMDFSDGGQ